MASFVIIIGLEKTQTALLKKQIKHLYTNFELHYTPVSFEKSVI